MMKRLIDWAIFALCLTTVMVVRAQNPFVQTNYVTDPAPLVVGDTLYVFTGHDEKNADFFWMQEWRVYSTTDMANWTDHGSPIAIEDFSWGDDRAWAPQCIERNGKFYLYVPLHSNLSGTMAIGVAVADSPTGPYIDPIGKPLADGSWDFIDPTVMIDDDGQAWLMWGNPRIYYARLNDDMVSFKDGFHKLSLSSESFGAPDPEERIEGENYADIYTEGPWLYKRDGKYYLIYAAGGIPEHIAYSMGESPLGPWKYMGNVMPLCDTGSFTNHSGTVDFKGHSYFFYHNGKLPGGGGFGRSVCVEEFKYNPDGTIPEILPTEEGVTPIGTLNPYGRTEAETMAFSSGIGVRQCDDKGVYVADIHNGDWLKLRNVDFGKKGPELFEISAASGLRGGRIEIHADSPEGPIVAELPVSGTGGWEKFKTFSAPANSSITGTHDLYFMFKGRLGPELFNLDWWQFKQ